MSGRTSFAPILLAALSLPLLTGAATNNLHLIDTGHAELNFGLEDNAFDLQVTVELPDIPDAQIRARRPSSQALFFGRPDSLAQAVPTAASYSFLGNPNDTVWIFPANFSFQNPERTIVGIASTNIPAGSLQNDTFAIELLSVTGPGGGRFSVFQTDVFGNPLLRMHSSDGIDPTIDRIVFQTATHDHYNYAFTATGYYSVTLQIRATNAAGQPLLSPAFQTHWSISEYPGFRDDDGNRIDDDWEARHGFTTPADPNADPDNDMKSNLKEYLFDTDPQTSDTNTPVFLITTNTDNSISLEINTKEGRQYRLMYSDDLVTWKPGSEKILGQRARLPFLDDGNGLIQGPPTNRFYRLDISPPQ